MLRCFFLLTLSLTLPLPLTGAPPVYDLVVYEATPGGIAMAVRAAREGLQVVLVNHHQHLGGILSSGLGVWDTLHEGRRSPVYDEARQAIFDHYRTTYGEDSPPYRAALPGKSGHTNGKFESKVAEAVLTGLVTREKNITVVRGYYPASVVREGALLRSVTFRELDGPGVRTYDAHTFADCSYEGDLAAVAGVPCRIGRESREEFGEPHAGHVFMRQVKAPATPVQARAMELHAQLNLRSFTTIQVIDEAASTGAGDANVQAFNYRTTLTKDPANRLLVEKPPGYDPALLATLEHGSTVEPLPGNKRGWNRPQLVGPHQAYVTGDWATRRRVMDEHWQATLGLLYYLQNDPSVPEKLRQRWAGWGLARDEYADNGHRPYEFYVREARRIVGRTTFTQHDASLAPGLPRAPLHADSIGVTEWYLDTHACTVTRLEGRLQEGKMMLDVETFPGQVPYRALLPEAVDNLLVPVCLSATHVAWGTIRLEPTWMNLAEAAAYAVAQARRHQQPPARIDTGELVKTLARQRVMVAFFNDLDLGADHPWVPAAQYFGTRGFFHDYDVRAAQPLKAATARLWVEALTGTSKTTPTEQARLIAKAEVEASPALSGKEFTRLTGLAVHDETAPMTRGEALTLLWQQVAPAPDAGK